MSPIAQRDAVINYARRFTHNNNPGDLSSDVIDRLIHERGLILDPMTSRDGVHAAMAWLNRGQRVAFGVELQRHVGVYTPARSAVPIPDTAFFDQVSAPPDILCKVLLKVIGKWDPKL